MAEFEVIIYLFNDFLNRHLPSNFSSFGLHTANGHWILSTEHYAQQFEALLSRFFILKIQKRLNLENVLK